MIALLAAAATLPFAPPLDRPLFYQVIERRPTGDGGTRSATLDETVRFAAEPGGGYAMTIHATGAHSAGNPDTGFAAAMASMVGTTVRIHLSAGGVPERIVDGAESWNAMLAALRMQIATHAAGSPAHVTAARMLASLEATPPAVRDARLLGTADDVLATRLPPLAVGATLARSDRTVTRAPDSGGDLHYRETVHQTVPGTPVRTLDEEDDVTVGHATGLVMRSLRRTRVDAVRVRESEIRLVGDTPR